MNGPMEKFIMWAVSMIVLIIFAPPFICFMDGVATFAHQTMFWLKTGIWVGQDFWSGIHRWLLTDRPSFDWVVPNRVLNWMLDGPRWIWMLVWSVILFCGEMALLIWGPTYVLEAWNKAGRPRNVEPPSSD